MPYENAFRIYATRGGDDHVQSSHACCILLQLTAEAWLSVKPSVARVRIEWHHERGMTWRVRDRRSLYFGGSGFRWSLSIGEAWHAPGINKSKWAAQNQLLLLQEHIFLSLSRNTISIKNWREMPWVSSKSERCIWVRFVLGSNKPKVQKQTAYSNRALSIVWMRRNDDQVRLGWC
jgi:hypothetical protein